MRFDCPDRIDAVGVETVPLNGLCQRWGDPDVERTKFFVNAGIDLNDSVELFGHLQLRRQATIPLRLLLPRSGYMPGTGGSGALLVDATATACRQMRSASARRRH